MCLDDSLLKIRAYCASGERQCVGAGGPGRSLASSSTATAGLASMCRVKVDNIRAHPFFARLENRMRALAGVVVSDLG